VIIRRPVSKFNIAAVVLVASMILLFGQVSAPVIDQPYAGDRNVTGQAAPGSVPLTVYDTTSNTTIYLGSGKSADQQGYFAVAVDPPLTLGHKIIVVDSEGRPSSEWVVMSKSGPTGPLN